MGLVAGGISYSKFFVRNPVSLGREPDPRAPLHYALEDGFRDEFVQNIHKHAFTPLNPEDEDEERCGWVGLEDPFDFTPDHNSLYRSEYLVLGFRIDRWRIPSQIFKAHYAEAEKQVMEQGGRERLSRKEKDELKWTVTRALRRKLMPTMKVIDLCWNLDTGVVRFFNQSAKTHELLDELFSETFGLELVLSGAYVEAMQLKNPKRVEAMEPLDGTAFHLAAQEAEQKRAHGLS